MDIVPVRLSASAGELPGRRETAASLSGGQDSEAKTLTLERSVAAGPPRQFQILPLESTMMTFRCRFLHGNSCVRVRECTGIFTGYLRFRRRVHDTRRRHWQLPRPGVEHSHRRRYQFLIEFRSDDESRWSTRWESAVRFCTVSPFSGGSVSVFHATIDPVVRFHYGGGRAAFYLTRGKCGSFHRTTGFTPSPAITNGASVPFLGISPANDVTPGGSVNKPGFDVGGGFEVGIAGRAKFFTEAKLEHMFLTASHMDFIPVSFGFRW